MGKTYHVFHGIYRTQHVRHVSHAYQPRPLIEQFFVFFLYEHALIGHGNDAQTDTTAFTQQLPRHDIRVMLHFGDDDLITLVQQFAERGCHQIDALRGAACKDDFAHLVGPDEAAHAVASLFHTFGHLLRQVVHPTMDVGVHCHIQFALGVNDTLRLLRRGRVVEIHQRFAVDLRIEYLEIFSVHHLLSL